MEDTLKNDEVSPENSFLVLITPTAGGKALEVKGYGEWDLDMIGEWVFTHKPSGEVFRVPKLEDLIK